MYKASMDRFRKNFSNATFRNTKRYPTVQPGLGSSIRDFWIR